MKAATGERCFCVDIQAISIHAAREGGDAVLRRSCSERRISIHAAREGGDDMTPDEVTAYQISIHAAREGGDAVQRLRLPVSRDFNPRRP